MPTEYSPCREIAQAPDEEANIALVRQGLLGASPFLPTLAFSLDLLEFYYCLRRRHPSVGTQGFAKVISAFHNALYYPKLQEKLAAAFDVYVDLKERLQKKTDVALNRVGDNWRALNGCPCCGFKQHNEPMLVPARLHAMDGNNSQKRLQGVGHTDEREFFSDYFIPPEQVDTFADEVKGTRRTAPATGPPVPDSANEDSDSLPTSNQPATKCTDSWQAANASAMGKSVTQVFEQTGIFLTTCRHGIVEFVEEMIKSGELAKYALASLDAIMKTYGADQGVGYDIGCSMDSTVRSTSLSERAAAQRLQLLVNAFHGYAHNRACQLKFHPLYRFGIGIEDLETCERIFSWLNIVARNIRHASLYHWRLFLHICLKQWDEDRYANLSKFLLDNYRQSLATIQEYEYELTAFQKLTGFAQDDFERWLIEEAAYLEKAQDEPEEDLQQVAYVENLLSLQKAQEKYGSITTVEFQTYTPADFASGVNLRPAALRARELERRAAQRKLEIAENVVSDLERRLGIEDRWTTTTPAFIVAREAMDKTEFVRAVEQLEGLVVQRLFELAKANISGTGYKMRKHISHAITRCSAAVRKAIDKYNELALLQSPPRPTFKYEDVANLSWLADFELLKESRSDILDRPWSSLANREAATKHFKVLRAREELVRLNVEIARLQAWVDHEDAELSDSARILRASDPLLAAHIDRLRCIRRQVNDNHRKRLQQIFVLPGYTGDVFISVESSTSVDSSLHDDAGDGDDVEIDGDDEVNEEVVRIGDLIESLSVQ
ncbi:hypothetical protein FA95DRAFT_1503682 [Auriscalpium vulgare]|uniref:Uncharacterized protein n=1 Tax=Auriscalpium vulgare TaxID=40419 RepID=A0ACB8R856_9AGAM|nr:hypothetical protein FA95DRAFT_1503682 [Auriscalpium vulgare]